MTRRPLRSKVLVSLLVVSLCGGLFVAPGVAHDSSSITHNWSRHSKPLAKKIFFTKRQANARFINVGEQASNANLLDGLDSTAFAQVGQSMVALWFKDSADTLPIQATSERRVRGARGHHDHRRDDRAGRDAHGERHELRDDHGLSATRPGRTGSPWRR